MKIVATSKFKIRTTLTAVLLSIFCVLISGSIWVIRKNAVDALVENTEYKTVIIDAGHGGIDGGTAADDGTLEKDLNLQIALKLDEMLRSMGVNTVLVRNTDISIHNETAKSVRQKKISDLKNRLKIMNETENAVFVSIHQNHFGQSKYCGTQIFYSKNSPLSATLAEKIRMPIITVLQNNNTREIKQSGTEIYLLHNAQIPAVMVECGFLSNAQEADNLKNEKYQQKLAFLITIGIIDYFTDTEDS